MQGTVTRDVVCATCSGKQSECPGHFGHINLVRPVFNVGYMDKIIHVLRCVCFYCSKVGLGVCPPAGPRVVTNPGTPDIVGTLQLKVPVTDPRIQAGMARTEGDLHNRLAETVAVCANVRECAAPVALHQNPADLEAANLLDVCLLFSWAGRLGGAASLCSLSPSSSAAAIKTAGANGPAQRLRQAAAQGWFMG